MTYPTAKTPVLPRADCALCTRRIELRNGRWIHIRYSYSAQGERHTAQPRQSAEVTV